MLEAKYKGREVELNKPMKGSAKKYQVYIKDPKTGKVRRVDFGDPDMEIKRDDPERRKAFRARHNCDQAKDKTTPRYWSCKFWGNKPVRELLRQESLEDWSGDWVRFTNHVQPFIAKKIWHQDPAGIYFFPKEFKRMGSWHTAYQYMVHAKLDPRARVLDLSKLSIDDMNKIINNMGIINKEEVDNPDRFWEVLQQHYMGKQIKFANDFRKLGYDAIFDDTKSIHSAETQLIVLNPSVMKVVDITETDKLSKYLNEIYSIVKNQFPEREATEEKWKAKRSWGEDLLTLKFKLLGDPEIEVNIESGGFKKEGRRREQMPTYVNVALYAGDKKFSQSVDTQNPDYNELKSKLSLFSKEI